MRETRKKGRVISKWMLGRLFAQLNKEALDITQSKITSFELAEILHVLNPAPYQTRLLKLFDYFGKVKMKISMI